MHPPSAARVRVSLSVRTCVRLRPVCLHPSARVAFLRRKSPHPLFRLEKPRPKSLDLQQRAGASARICPSVCLPARRGYQSQRAAQVHRGACTSSSMLPFDQRPPSGRTNANPQRTQPCPRRVVCSLFISIPPRHTSARATRSNPHL